MVYCLFASYFLPILMHLLMISRKWFVPLSFCYQFEYNFRVFSASVQNIRVVREYFLNLSLVPMCPRSLNRNSCSHPLCDMIGLLNYSRQVASCAFAFRFCFRNTERVQFLREFVLCVHMHVQEMKF